MDAEPTMNVTADQGELADALSWVGMALPTRTPYPALLGIHLRAKDGRLTLTAYDDLGAHVRTLEAEIHEPGSALLPGALLRDLVNALPRGSVELAAHERGAELETGSAHYRLGVLPLDDYPPIPELPARVGTVHRAGDLADMLSAIGPAIDDVPDTARGGIHLDAAYSELALVGVSPTLVIYRTIDWYGEEFRERISPGLFRDAIKGFEPDATLEVGCSHGLLSLSDADRTAVMRLYNPAKMEWRKLFRPDDDPQSVTVDNGSLAGALRRAALLNPGVVRLSAGTNDLWLKAESDDGSLELINAPQVRGGLDIRMNPSLLSLATNSVRGPSELVRISSTGQARSSVIVRSADDEIHGAAVVAPKRES